MQDYTVVTPVGIVLVSVPVRCVYMHLHIARPHCFSYAYHCRRKIRPCIGVVYAGVDDLYLLAVCRLLRVGEKGASEPNIMKKQFRHGRYVL